MFFFKKVRIIKPKPKQSKKNKIEMQMKKRSNKKIFVFHLEAFSHHST